MDTIFYRQLMVTDYEEYRMVATWRNIITGSYRVVMAQLPSAQAEYTAISESRGNLPVISVTSLKISLFQ